MNIYKRLFCVLLVFVLLFVQFLPLHTVHATENNEDYGISLLNLEPEDYDGQTVFITESFYNGSTGKNTISSNTHYLSQEVKLLPYTTINNFNSSAINEVRIMLKNADNSRLFTKGSNLHFSVNNLVNSISVNNSDYYRLEPYGVYEVIFYFKDINNSFKAVTTRNFSFNMDNNYLYNLDVTVDVPCDTYNIFIGYRYYYKDYLGVGTSLPSTISSTDTVSLQSGFYNSVLTFDETDGTKGLLANIIQIVTNIKDGVTNLPSKIASSIKGFFDNIVNAVVNLGTTILDGIKNLFVPSEEDITEMKDRWTDLLRDRFGALYQTVELIDSYGKSFQAQEKNTITMPSIDLALAGAVFTFGGWEVQVVPEGFDVLFNALKLIISIVCTIWFVNGLKNRFEKLVGGADNI